MFNSTSWETELRKLIEGFTMALQQFMKEISSLPQVEAERRVEEYGKSLLYGSNSLSQAQHDYKKIVEAYIKKFPPQFSNDISNNLKEHDKLIAYSLRIGDSDLLIQWGLVYPRNQGFSWINDSSQKAIYSSKLQVLRQRRPAAKVYYDTLIDALC